MKLEAFLKHPSVSLNKVGGNAPFPLLGDQVWLVLKGVVHLFGQKDLETRRTPFLERAEGQVMFGLTKELVVAVGTPDCQVAQLSLKDFLSLEPGLVARLTEEWLLDSSRSLAPGLVETRLLESGESLRLEAQDKLSNQSIQWLEIAPKSVQYAEWDRPLGSFLPLPPALYVIALEPTEASAFDTSAALREKNFSAGLQDYHRWVVHRISQRATKNRDAHQTRIEQREASKLAAFGEGLHRLAKVLPGEVELLPPVGNEDDLLFETVKKVGEAQSMKVVRPQDSGENDLRDPLTRISQASGFRTRVVSLTAGWWRKDVGSLVASRNGGQPVAIIRERSGRYQIYDFADGSKTAVNESVAKGLDPNAYVLYRPLPHDCTNFTKLLQFALPAIEKDLKVLAVVCLLGSFMAMAMPVGLGLLTDPVIPSGQVTELGALGLGLALAVVVSACASLGQAITALRIGGRVDSDVQAAITDRLMGLPAPFFRRYSSGDLTNRLLGFQAMVQTVTGTALSAVLAGMMSTTNLLLMFYYDRYLALIGLGLVLVLLSFLAFCSWLDLGLQRTLADARGKLGGLVFQLIGGISKLRVAAAQARAFEIWSQEFARRTKVVYSSGLIQANINAIMPIYNTASLIAFFGYMAHYKYLGVQVSDFLALTSAYGAFVGAVNLAARSLTNLLTTVPLAERFQPILAESGEVAENLAEPGELSGAVEVCNVSFRYGPDEPRVLKDVSVKANPGEFVAIVGPSGSGKSTIFRMLVGFETPSQGTILFDGQDLASLNMQSVRRQLGVVLQNGKLMPGSIVSNIIGSALLTIDDAWAAAEIAGLAEDIKAMPMGMHTVVSEGGSAFSGGQSQRLLIARAVVSQPKILLLDEATSALDSKTQAQVSEQLTNLRATRIVIAHRLSTIENADRIYVVQDGVVVQVGNYEELIAVPGTFQELAKRQLL